MSSNLNLKYPQFAKSENLDYSNWLREQGRNGSLPSKRGIRDGVAIVVNDLDFVISNYDNPSERIFVTEESKCYMAEPTYPQKKDISTIDRALRLSCPQFLGYHIIQFERTCPTDGKIYIDGILRTVEELVEFNSCIGSRELYDIRPAYIEKRSGVRVEL